MKRNWLSLVVISVVALSVWGGLLLPKASAAMATEIIIERFVYDGQVATTEGDEYVKICNISGSSIDLAGGGNPWRLGDEETSAGSTAEGMYNLQGTLAAGGCFIIALNANGYNSIRGLLPDYEMVPAQTTDNPAVPNLTKINTGNWALANGGDNITLWRYNGSAYVQHDEIAYGTTAARYSEVGLAATGTYQVTCGSNANCAIVRSSVSGGDTDNMATDFNNISAPNAVTLSDLSAASTTASPAPLILAGLGVAAAALLLRRKLTRASTQN